tara:strand:- start:572 stop:823 length:252 start_codon:yes stop_codon:yes gene_type:complete
MTVREMLARIDSLELAEWMVYYGLDPFGNERTDLQAGIIASTIANANSAKGKTFQASDFMPFKEQQEQSSEDMKNILNTMAGK